MLIHKLVCFISQPITQYQPTDSNIINYCHHRIRERHKTGKAAIITVARKMLILIYTL